AGGGAPFSPAPVAQGPDRETGRGQPSQGRRREPAQRSSHSLLAEGEAGEGRHRQDRDPLGREGDPLLLEREEGARRGPEGAGGEEGAREGQGQAARAEGGSQPLPLG